MHTLLVNRGDFAMSESQTYVCPAISHRFLVAVNDPEEDNSSKLGFLVPTKVHSELRNHDALATCLNFGIQARITGSFRRQSADLAERRDDSIETFADAVTRGNLRTLVVASNDTLEDSILGRRYKHIVQCRYNWLPSSREHVCIVNVGVTDSEVFRGLSLDQQLLPSVLECVLVVVFFGQHDLSLFDRVVDVFEVLLVKVVSTVDTSQVACKVLQLHAVGTLDVWIVLISVQHDDGISEDKDSVLVSDALWFRAVDVLFAEDRDDALDQCRFSWEAESVQDLAQRLIDTLIGEVELIHEGIENGFVRLLGDVLAQDLLVDPGSAAKELRYTSCIVRILNDTLAGQVCNTALSAFVELRSSLDDDLFLRRCSFKSSTLGRPAVTGSSFIRSATNCT